LWYWAESAKTGALMACQDYRGSEARMSTKNPLPVPLSTVQRQHFSKRARDGNTRTLVNKIRVKVNLSVNLPTRRAHTAARNGLPDLLPTVEIVPRLKLHLLRSDDSRIKFDLRMPLPAPAFNGRARLG